MQTRIEFIRGGSNTILGDFAPGDVFRAPSALARHLVEEAKVARYIESKVLEPAPAVETRKRGRK